MDYRIKLCDFEHTADVGDLSYQAPEAQTNEYNHLIDIYSLSLIGSQIFGFNVNDIIDGKNGRFFKICDFGLATVHKHKSVVGDKDYCAPEVEWNDYTYNHMIDVYRTGVLVNPFGNLILALNEPVVMWKKVNTGSPNHMPTSLGDQNVLRGEDCPPVDPSEHCPPGV
ncbi:unnamed protein product [Oppiella nova]|uniref:Protein kinase domain-containing protein n=1 Tax=Oppiella nova TaxID=334625 RepID=A0A7R9QI14_9ACAR|nr:unnamed protein product [Oppiella nova]CAG2166230.1 unnamed protein product [Oppiella nova]